MTTVAISWLPKQRDICIPPPCCLPSFLSSSLSPSPFSLFTHLNQMDSSSPEWGYLASNPQSQTPFHHSQKVRQSHVVWYHTCLPTTLVARGQEKNNKIGELWTFPSTTSVSTFCCTSMRCLHNKPWQMSARLDMQCNWQEIVHCLLLSWVLCTIASIKTC